MPSLRDPAKQRIGVILWVSVMVLVFSVLLNIFKVKNGGQSTPSSPHLRSFGLFARNASSNER